MKRLKQRRISQRRRPDHMRRLNDEPIRHSRHTQPKELHRQRQQKLVPGRRLESIKRRCLLPLNDVCSPRRAEREVRHDGDDGVLLDVEVVVRVEAELAPEQPQLHHGEEVRDGATDGEGEQLRDEGGDGNAGVPHGEKLVDAGADDGEEHADEPHAQGVDGHGRVVYVGDVGAYFGEWGVVRVDVVVFLDVGDGDGGRLVWRLELIVTFLSDIARAFGKRVAYWHGHDQSKVESR